MPFPLLMAAAAAINTVGITDAPCPPPLLMPPELLAWRQQVYAPGNHSMLPPPPAAVTYGNAYLEARRTDWADVCHYFADNQQLRTFRPNKREVIFMGDSITEGWGIASPFFFHEGWLDRGISGQTTQQMLVRFPADVIALHPRVVHIMAGTNDVAGNTGPATMDMVEANIAAMVTLAKANGIRVVLAAVPPTVSFTWAPALRPAPVIAALNARLRTLATREGAVFIDYGTVLATPEGAMKPDLTLDGVHPATAGYTLMEPIAKAAIANALAQR